MAAGPPDPHREGQIISNGAFRDHQQLGTQTFWGLPWLDSIEGCPEPCSHHLQALAIFSTPPHRQPPAGGTGAEHNRLRDETQEDSS